MHARGHQREKRGGSQVSGDRPDKDVLGQARPAEEPDDASGGIAEQGHDEHDIGDHAHEQGEQRRKDHVHGLGHDVADRLLHMGDQKRPRDDGQHAAFSAAEGRVQRDLGIVQAHNGGDLIDAVQRGDHAQHAAQDGRPSKAFRSAIAGPGGQEGHHGAVDQGQDLVNEGPDLIVPIVRYGLGYERGEARAESRADDAGEQRKKNVPYDSQRAPDPVPFHRSSLLSAK